MGIQVAANPTKQFFVSSLTRDIELEDAILDLLDNCVDGIMRTNRQRKGKKATVEEAENDVGEEMEAAVNDEAIEVVNIEANENVTKEKPYSGFFAKITANPEEFEIQDNCGGIPREVAINQAFKFGRSANDIDSDLPTVGMYGIGMKRALFKLGKSSLVESAHSPHKYNVEILDDWLHDENSWKLNLEEEEYKEDEDDGTHIIVSDLYDPIKKQFDPNQSTFLKALYDKISQNFALIIKKGFEIYLNGVLIKPVSLSLLSSNELEGSGDSITPYLYSGTFGSVNVEIAIGFYSELSAIDETGDAAEIERSRKNAGITVICNDRVVLHRDKTIITGWGSSSVPSFHNQFISIAGILNFSSFSSKELPLTTTKRGIDLSSSVYWEALEFCKRGLKKFTDFTNKWKGRENEVSQAFAAASLVESTSIVKKEKENLRKVARSTDQYQHLPNLPKPIVSNNDVRISFIASKDDIAKIIEYFHSGVRISPSELGRWCFDRILETTNK